MKKTIVGFILMTTILVIAPSITGYIETHYTREAKVTEVTGENIVVEDTTNNVWSFEGDGFIVGDKVTLKMDNNCTDNTIYDDVIVKVEKRF